MTFGGWWWLERRWQVADNVTVKNMTVSRESVDETEIRRDPSKVGASVVSSDFFGIHSIYFAHHCL